MKIPAPSSLLGGSGMPRPSPIGANFRQYRCSEWSLRTIPKVGFLLPRMQRFNVGDSVLVLPRFAHLFPTNIGVVTGINADPFRSMFNEYTLKLDNGTAATVFEFQLLEDELKYQTFVAALIFDSDVHLGTNHLRGPATDRRVVLQTPSMDIDMKIKRDQNLASIIGQILERSSPRLVAHAEISLLKDNVVLSAAIADKTGTFSFPSVGRGPLNVQILIRHYEWRILGMFSV